jgi:hypothetical protein
MMGAKQSVCCACGAPTASGIFVKGEPEGFWCVGKAGHHA